MCKKPKTQEIAFKNYLSNTSSKFYFNNGSSIQELDYSTFLQLNEHDCVYIGDCSEHSLAYCLDDIDAGKLSLTTLKRYLFNEEPACQLCRHEKGFRPSLHAGARLYYTVQKLLDCTATHEIFQRLPARSLLINNRSSFIIPCSVCGEDNPKTVADFTKKGRLRKSPLLCATCAKQANDGSLKYTLADLRLALKVTGHKLVKVVRINGKALTEKDSGSEKISSNDIAHITCAIHRTYSLKTKVSTIFTGSYGCIDCALNGSGSNNEKLVHGFLRTIVKKEPFYRSRPPFLKAFHYDFYWRDLKIAIEVQGTQHYEYVPAFHKSEDGFRAQQKRDKLKKELSMSNGVNLICFDARYIEKTYNFKKQISNLLEKLLPRLLETFESKRLHTIFEQNEFQTKLKENIAWVYKEYPSLIDKETLSNSDKAAKKVGAIRKEGYRGKHRPIVYQYPDESRRQNTPHQFLKGQLKGTTRRASLNLLIEVLSVKKYLIAATPLILPEKFKATSGVAITCLCGAKSSCSASINGLSTKYVTCACMEDVSAAQIIKWHHICAQTNTILLTVPRELPASVHKYRAIAKEDRLLEQFILYCAVEKPEITRLNLCKILPLHFANRTQGWVRQRLERNKISTAEQRIALNLRVRGEPTIMATLVDEHNIPLFRRIIRQFKADK
jgi:hypothetical protein